MFFLIFSASRVNPLSTTIVALILFYYPIISLLLEAKCVFIHLDLQMFGIKLNKYE